MFGTGFGATRGKRAAAIVLCLTLLSGCSTYYVEDTLHDLAANEKVEVANAEPVQLLFAFQEKGVIDAQATDLIKSEVQRAVHDSGLFSYMTDDPVPNGALLRIVINDVPLTDDPRSAYNKGLVTGATLGLVGNTVGDGFICTIDYLPSANSQKIARSMRDAIYMSLGMTTTAPQHVRQVSSLDEANKMLVRQLVSNTLNELAKDKGFSPAITVSAK
jgi:hypothetical protein